LKAGNIDPGSTVPDLPVGFAQEAASEWCDKDYVFTIATSRGG
jgi:hypothetical protein